MKRNSLINNIESHTGEKPYKCVLCDQYFKHLVMSGRAKDLYNAKLFYTLMILHKKVLQNSSTPKILMSKRSIQIFISRNIQHTVLSVTYLC